MHKTPVSLLVMFVLSVTPALGHDYWIERTDDAYVLYQGHLYSPHQGEAEVVYDPALVKSALCASASGEVRALPRPDTYPARFGGPCATLLVDTSSGYWSQTLTGATNQPKTEVFAALRSWLSQESIKLVDAWSPSLSRPLGGGLELVPMSDPFAVRTGEKLRLLAVFRGAPKAGVTVAYDGSPRGATGEDGQINIRLRHAETQVITASFEEPLDDERADKILHSATLQFQLKD